MSLLKIANEWNSRVAASTGGFDFHDGEWEELVASCREQIARDRHIGAAAAEQIADGVPLNEIATEALEALYELGRSRGKGQVDNHQQRQAGPILG